MCIEYNFTVLIYLSTKIFETIINNTAENECLNFLIMIKESIHRLPSDDIHDRYNWISR
jgi:hypothetical protein